MALLKTPQTPSPPSEEIKVPETPAAPPYNPDLSEHLERIENSRKEMEGLILAIKQFANIEEKEKKAPSTKFLKLMEILKNGQ